MIPSSISKLTVKFKAIAFGALCFAFAAAPASALDFTFNFTNGGNAGSPGDVVSGRVLGLNDNNWTFSPVTVWVDSVLPSVDPAFTVPYSWTANITAHVTAGVIDSISFFADDGKYAVNLGVAFFALTFQPPPGNNYAYVGKIQFASASPVVTPDAGSTLAMLGAGLVGFVMLRRRLS